MNSSTGDDAELFSAFPSRLLSLNDVSARLGVSPKVVRRLVSAGHLRATFIGRMVRVRPMDLNHYMELARAAGDSLTLEEVAARLNVSTNSVRKLIAAGHLRGTRDARMLPGGASARGGGLRVRQADLDAFLASTVTHEPQVLPPHD